MFEGVERQRIKVPGFYPEWSRSSYNLHAHILSSFAEAGVEITSPHYRAVRDGNTPAIPPVEIMPEEAPAG